ncbi:beta-ketoacyl synthase N-terminal-like domain-containing protein [Fulvivirga sediminis]|uniref:Beta-ketoacyl-[acyl-carrier-protein] synthase family protein n=1 Tax=Fulvivirga sediminis TaxID=2803949 RepID=A0A937F9N3_9BACT|nr:beta-ketoacyl synthase N-terminal-like domain-containing protein [Fulvivirga sediminis]MBL3656839.1 beta-ketoacyl-[acyl-carrier-protein] synthase family protein [Fulvivirga sediminis]
MKIYSVADNITSPLGITTIDNFEACLNDETGIKTIENSDLYPTSFLGGLIEKNTFPELFQEDKYTHLENLFIHSIKDALQKAPEIDEGRTALVISTTKGNIDLLAPTYKGEMPAERVLLSSLAKTLSVYFGLSHSGVVVSNACISGVSALLTAKMLIETGQYDHAIVTGGDILSEFTISGFQCLKAMSDEPCQPYDTDRKGISLGEACGTMIVSNQHPIEKEDRPMIEILGGGQANDANHISGPSRTGEGLKNAIKRAIKASHISIEDIDYINAHGTATSFNDEMEAIAFDTLGLSQIPLNSLKGFFGHTLGAAGIIESIMTIEQMRRNLLISTKNFKNMGVSKKLNIVEEIIPEFKSTYALKTTSGFGGCNAAIIFQKYGN